MKHKNKINISYDGKDFVLLSDFVQFIGDGQISYHAFYRKWQRETQDCETRDWETMINGKKMVLTVSKAKFKENENLYNTKTTKKLKFG